MGTAATMLLLVVIALTACGGTAGTAATPTPHPTSTAAASPSHNLQSDVDREASSPDPNFDYGYTIQVTGDGFHPRWLIAACCKPITWRNLTAATVSVVFDHIAGKSGPIPPGGTFVFTPTNVESIAYHSGTDPSIRAVIQVNQTVES